MARKVIDNDNLGDLWGQVKSLVDDRSDKKVDKVQGKGLSANDYTNEDKNKLDGIETGAKVNVQPDWSQTDNSQDDFIKNKPSIPSKTSDLTNDSNFAVDANYTHTDNNFTNADKEDVAKIGNLEHSLSTTKTATGNPISVSDSAHVNAEELKVELEPKQDLHGYDNPWVGGAGKNKLPMTVARIKAANTDGTWTGNVYTINDATFEILTDNADNVTGIKVNGTPSSEVRFSLHGFGNGAVFSENAIMTGCPSGGSNNSYKLYISNNTANDASDTGSGVSLSPELFNSAIYNSLFTWIVISANYTATNLIFYPMIRLATETDPTFEPYSNICPINGYDETSVVRGGGNQFDVSSATANSVIVKDSGEVQTSSEYFSSAVVSDYMIVSQNTRYKYFPNGSANVAGIVFFDKDKNYISGMTTNEVIANDNTVTIPSNCKYVRATFYIDTSVENYFGLASNYTGYEPYTADTYTLQFGDTVYGGTLNVTSGELVVDKVKDSLESLTYTKTAANSSVFFTDSLIGKIKPCGFSDEITDAITSIYNHTIGINAHDAILDYSFGLDGNGRIYINDSTKIEKDATEFKASLTGQSIVYTLTTPYTIQLTPQQIKMLKGNNVLTADGDMDLTYQTDSVVGDVKEWAEEKMDELNGNISSEIASNIPLVINFSKSGNTYSCDTPFTEVYQVIKNGGSVFAKYDFNDRGAETQLMIGQSYWNEEDEFPFWISFYGILNVKDIGTSSKLIVLTLNQDESVVYSSWDFMMG